MGVGVGAGVWPRAGVGVGVGVGVGARVGVGVGAGVWVAVPFLPTAPRLPETAPYSLQAALDNRMRPPPRSRPLPLWVVEGGVEGIPISPTMWTPPVMVGGVEGIPRERLVIVVLTTMVWLLS